MSHTVAHPSTSPHNAARAAGKSELSPLTDGAIGVGQSQQKHLWDRLRMAPQRFPSLRSGGTWKPRTETATATATGPHCIPHTPATTTTTTTAAAAAAAATLDAEPTPAPAPAPALIALPYELTAWAQPPILLPPPRNPLRTSRRPPAQLPSSPAPPLTTTAISTPTPTATSDLHRLPPPVPARDQHQEQVDAELHPRLHLRLHLPLHPAVRRQCQSNHSPASSTSTTASTAASSICADWRRDSLLGTLSSASATLHEEDEEDDDDEDAFRYDYHGKLDVADTPSIYSTDEPTPAPSSDEPCTPQHASRPSFQSRWSVTDSDTSEVASINCPRDTATKRLVKGLSLKLPPPPMKRLRKKSLTEAVVAPTPPHSPQSHHSGLSQPSPAPHLSPSPRAPDSVRDSRQEIHHFDSHIQSPNPSGPRPLSEHPQPPQNDFHPINTSIPEGRFLDDIDTLNFSKRGSILFGGKRAVSPPNPAPGPSPMQMQMSPSRAAPAPAPAPAEAASTPDAGAPDPRPALASQQPTPRDSARKLSLPNIRVMSVDTERESQKVRSLYESGDLVNWQDGAPGSPGSPPGEPAQSGDQLPSDGEDIAAERRRRQSVRALYLCPNTPLSATSLPSPQGNTRRSEYELAGGIEDWENVQVDDVDRYGFIHLQRPKSRRSIPAETHSLHSTVGRRNGRNVLTKRADGPSSQHGLSRIPSRKVSARSLNTQTSGVSTSSRFTVRSGIRTAANLLPHNRDRKAIDEAGEMLGLPPGLVDIEEEQKSEQALKDAHEREVKRTEKWRKMAKTVIKGRDGKGVKFAVEDIAKVKRSKGSEQHFEIQGTVIEFDVKSPKLIERTWKGIPDCWRGAAWYSFLSASAQNAKSDTTDEQLFAEFHRLQDASSPDDTQIDLDVPRTINKHIMFRKRYRGGQRLLFRVLHAMSLYFPDTGYVQGMAGLAATMLCYYDEERCFVMLVRLWQFRGLERLYQPGFAGLMLALKDLENHWLHGKAAAQKLNEMGIDPTAYGTRWYLTLFNLSIPFAAQLRVWDVFMLLGGSSPSPDPSVAKEKETETTFNGLEILHATSAALIDGQKELIIDADFENVMKALTSAQPVKDEDRFMNVVRAEWNVHRKKRRS